MNEMLTTKNIFMSGPDVGISEEKIVIDAIRNGWYGKDAYSYVELFEKEFSKFHDREYALMTPNCTTSMHLLLAGLGISGEDEIIAPECTWIGSVAGVKYLGANLVFADIDKENWCLNAETIKSKITSKTKAVIVVNLYGNMPDYEEIIKLCKSKNIFLIEDAAESLGSMKNGIRSGKFGVGSVFSFHRTKTITTGEGGILLLDDKKLYERCKFLRDHGRKPGSFYNTEVTFKYMPFNVQAALGYAQFLRIDELLNKKRFIYKRFTKNLERINDIQLNPEPENTVNGAWATALILGKSYKLKNEKLMEELNKFNLPSRPFFYPLSSLPAFNESKLYKKLNPVAYDISSRGIVLPCALNLNIDQIDHYSEKLVQILKKI